MPFPTFKKKEDIPKGFEGEYEELNGEWHAKAPDVSKIEETLGKVRAEKKDAEKIAKEATEKAADLQRQLDVAKAAGGDVEKKTGEMLEKWNKDKDAAVATVQGELDKTKAELRTMKLDDKIKAAALAAGVLPTKVDAVLKLTKDRFDLADGDKIVVKDEKGEVSTATVKDFFEKTYKGQMPELYQGTKAAGGGANGGAGGKPATGDPKLAEQILADPLSALKTANREQVAAAS